MPDQTPALDDFRRAYEADDNEWWLLDCGHHMNLFDEAIDRIDEARDWATWFAAERDELARQRAFELEAIAERQRMYRDRIAAEEQRAGEMARLAIAEQESAAALRARIAELEAASPAPAGYVVVTRNSEGGVHRSATVWDSLEQANTAEGIASGYADGTGCTAAVYELREVQQ